MDPTGEDSQTDRIKAVLQPEHGVRRENKIIIILSDSELGSCQGKILSPPKNCDSSLRARPSIFRVFAVRIDYERQLEYPGSNANNSAPN